MSGRMLFCTMNCCVSKLSANRPLFVEQMMREGLEARQRAKQQIEDGHTNVSAYDYGAIPVGVRRDLHAFATCCAEHT